MYGIINWTSPVEFVKNEDDSAMLFDTSEEAAAFAVSENLNFSVFEVEDNEKH